MIPTNLSRKGQLTIPKHFRQRMKLTGRQRVILDQLADGTVVVRPARSILHLAGSVPAHVPPLSVQEERDAIHQAMAERSKGKDDRK